MAKMGRILAFAVFFAVLLLIPKIQSQRDTPPLCITQFALVNHACAFLPPPDDDDTVPPSPPSPPAPSPPSPPSPPPSDDDGDGDGDGGSDGQSHIENGGKYNQSLVDDDSDSGDDHHNRHHHHHRQGHRHRQGRRATDVEEECCRWLKEVDDECVCGLLGRLPPFLSKLEHNYTVTVNRDCEVTFECQGLYGE